MALKLADVVCLVFHFAVREGPAVEMRRRGQRGRGTFGTVSTRAKPFNV
jgi:hypothetical protein